MNVDTIENMNPRRKQIQLLNFKQTNNESIILRRNWHFIENNFEINKGMERKNLDVLTWWKPDTKDSEFHFSQNIAKLICLGDFTAL